MIEAIINRLFIPSWVTGLGVFLVTSNIADAVVMFTTVSLLMIMKGQKEVGMKPKYGWKDENGDICQFMIAGSKEELFEMAGFGAVDVDKPLKGKLAVPVVDTKYGWMEVMKRKVKDHPGKSKLNRAEVREAARKVIEKYRDENSTE